MENSLDNLLIEQDLALDAYIGDLLNGNPVEPIAEQEPTSEPARKSLSNEDWSELARTLKTMDVEPTDSLVELETSLAQTFEETETDEIVDDTSSFELDEVDNEAVEPVAVDVEPIAIPVRVASEEPAVATAPTQTAPPPVAQPVVEVYTALVCQIGGLKVGISIDDVARITLNDRKYVKSDGFTYYEVQGEERKVIELKDVLLPEQYRRSSFELSKRIVVLSKHPWAVACDDAGEIITIPRSDIRWRSDQTRRRWLLGTSLDKGMVLLDVKHLTDTNE